VRAARAAQTPQISRNQFAVACPAPALKASDVSFNHEFSLKMEQKPDISSSGAAKAEADPAYVNLKVKQQVALCRGSIRICIDIVFRMAQLPISELSAAHNSKRYAACNFCLPSFFVTPDLLPHPFYAAHRFFLSASIDRPPRSQVVYCAITCFSTYLQRPYRASRML
jgi:hypothetical protein